jgi:hypothetical protein
MEENTTGSSSIGTLQEKTSESKNKTTYYTISPNEIRKDSSHKASPQG